MNSRGVAADKGYVFGDWRRAVNVGLNDGYGHIHDDATAKEMGLRGGAVVGFLNLNLFPPVLLKVFGPRWFERGSLSAFYTYALTHGDEARAVVGAPPGPPHDTQVEMWAETRDGHKVLKGTASVGEPKEIPYLHTIEMKNAGPGEIRILAGVKPGDECPPREVFVTQQGLNSTLRSITDPMDWYLGGSPWGEAVVPPSDVARLMQHLPWGGINVSQSDHAIVAWAHYDRAPESIRQAVQIQGAVEIENVNGPMKVGVHYLLTGRIICVGASPKTEFFWYDSNLFERGSDKLVARSLQLIRFMKASSSLWK